MMTLLFLVAIVVLLVAVGDAYGRGYREGVRTERAHIRQAFAEARRQEREEAR